MYVNRRQILNSFLETLEGISSKEYQKRIWIQGQGPEIDDFDETCCHFFDMGDSILKNCQEYGLSKSQYQILKNFRDEFEEFSDENDWPPEFIDTPEWARIMGKAKEVLKAFNKRIRK